MKKFILFIACICFCNVLNAQQSYRTALGLRLNGGAGFTVKHALNERNSIEGILYTRWRGVNLTGLYQVNYPVFNEPGFNFYMGGGGHIGVWDGRYAPWWDEDDNIRGSHVVVGIDGQIGLEYTFQEIPLNLGLDWKPALNFISPSYFWADDFALSVRYAIK